MDINFIILLIISAGIILGGLDYIIKNRYGFGEEFENGLKALGPLALAMVGIISLAPIIGNFIRPLVNPLLHFIGADPSLVASIIAVDMGGYSIAKNLALTQSSAAFSGLIVASMLGATVVFSIPVALNIVKKSDLVFFIKGLLGGTITIPIGAFIGGLAAGFPTHELLLNMIPVLLISFSIVTFLIIIPRQTMQFVFYFGQFILSLSIVGLILASIEFLTGIVILPGMAHVTEGIKIIGIISLVLMGAFPLIKLANIVFRKFFEKFGTLLGVNSSSVVGMLATMVNNIPMFSSFERMDDRGKIINSAFMVSGAFILGDHLGFVVSVDKSMIAYVMLAKITAALLAIPVALLIARKTAKIVNL